MDYKEPKTRQEVKGVLTKKHKDTLYMQKRVRQMESIMEKKSGKQKNWTRGAAWMKVHEIE